MNPSLKLGLRLNFDARILPYFNEWKMMGEDLYVLAIEPMNCDPLGGRETMRTRKTLPFLLAGESCPNTLEIEVVEYDQMNQGVTALFAESNQAWRQNLLSHAETR